MVTGNPVVESIIETNRYLLIDSSREIFDMFYYNYINTVNILMGQFHRSIQLKHYFNHKSFNNLKNNRNGVARIFSNILPTHYNFKL